MNEEMIMDLNNTIIPDGKEMEGKHLTFWIDRQLFGISIAQVEQIVGMQSITELPNAPLSVKGIINLRGEIIPLIDIRLRLGKPEIAYDGHTCIIVTKLHERTIGLIVDEVEEVAYIPDDLVSIPPAMGHDKTSEYVTGVARIEVGEANAEKILLLLDIAKMLPQEEIASEF